MQSFLFDTEPPLPMATQPLAEQDVHERMLLLYKVIAEHNDAYYVRSEPTISDYEFDQLLKELEQLEQDYPHFVVKNSPTQRVGGVPLTEFRSVMHTVPMLSLQNTYSTADIEDFDRRVREGLAENGIHSFQYVADLKYDGVAISLTYRAGTLTIAATRGDGVQGDDVTANIRTIHSLPLRVREVIVQGERLQNFEVRGEVFLRNDDFLRINAEREEQGEKLYANPRNLASGTLKQLDSSLVAQRPLCIVCYWLDTDEAVLHSHADNMRILKELGFPTAISSTPMDTIADVKSYIDQWETERETLPFQTDGMVVKVNQMHHQKILGAIAKFPRWAIAYKYSAQQAQTLLRDISIQIGRTGVATPVAELAPVLLAGSTISRATLHNIEYIQNIDIRCGDTVIIEKGGDVIPKVVRPVLEKRPSSVLAYQFPTTCICAFQQPLKRYDDEANFYCDHSECPSQVRGKLIHFASRKAMDIEGLGDKNVDQLVSEGLLHSLADIYELHKHIDALQRLERWGEKKAYNLLQGIERSKEQPFTKVLFALGIRFIGEETARLLSESFASMDTLSQASLEQLTAIHGIGERTAHSLVYYFSQEVNRSIITRLALAGLSMNSSTEEMIKHHPAFIGKTFVITGTFQEYSREDIMKSIQKRGGKVSGSVSKKTHYVLAGESAGSKLTKAHELGIQILNEKEFITMLHTA